MFISQPFKERVKPRTEGCVNYKRAAWLGHKAAPWKEEWHSWEKGHACCSALTMWLMVWHCLFQVPSPLFSCPWDKGVKAGCFSLRNHCTSPATDYLEALSDKCTLPSFGGKIKESLQYIVCLLDGKTEWFPQPGSTWNTQCEGQKETETTCATVVILISFFRTITGSSA